MRRFFILFMPLILNLETSTDVCSVALYESRQLLAAAEVREPQAHAARLAPMIEQVTRQAGIRMQELSAIAISAGPGSYTGLRIGTSCAKGLCYALDIPLIAVGTLELLAFQGNSVNASGALLCPMIDARRMEVYCLVADSQLQIKQPVSAKIIDENSFAELLETGRVLFLGNGAEKCKTVLRHHNAMFLDDIYPVATSLGILTEKKFSAGQFEDVVAFKPFYLKEFVAKRPERAR